MSLKAMYNTIAHKYDTANRFGSISDSHVSAIEQIKNTQLSLEKRYRVLDLGVGDGAFLKKLQPYIPNAEYTGIDVSREMLKHAQRTLPLNVIEGSAADAPKFVPSLSQDLVLAHFINAYIPIDKLFQAANTITRSTGYFSMITTTYESFPVAQKNLANFIATESILSRIVGHYYKSVMKNTTVASGQDELFSAFEQHHFNIVEHQRLEIPIVLNNIDELALFGIEGTWFLNTLSIRMLPKNFLLQRLKRLFSQIFTFPYEDTHIIDVVLAQK